MNCPKCSSDVPDSSLFCPKCGAPAIAPPQVLMARPTQPDRPYQWVYKLAQFSTQKDKSWLTVDGDSFEAENVVLKLDELGSEGWELVAVAPIISAGMVDNIASRAILGPQFGSTTSGYWLWFKRATF